MHTKAQRLKVLSSGILSLILTMGIGRFALTPMLPIMQEHAGLGISEGGGLAAVNYLGYLCGALVVAMISDLVIKDRLYRIGLVMALVTTIGMGLTENIWLWALFRFLAGLSCAAGILLGAGLVLNWLIRHGHRSELGIHFCGVGLGIVLCAIAIEWMQPYFDWHQQWGLLTLIGVLIIIPAWRWLPPPDKAQHTTSGEALIDSPPSAAFMRIFQVAYFCAGVGYVISATFIVAIIDQLPGLEGQGIWAFLIMGLAAIPSAIGWDLVARRFGPLNALITCSMLQVIGILLPVIEANFILTMIGAILYGGTFVGMVCLVLTMAGRYYPTRPAKMMGKMTLSFGSAQIIAPALAGLLAEHSGSYTNAVYMAAFIMALGSVLLLVLKSREPAKQPQLAPIS
ncbi:YbfB/YjiJ family MFS transporter [Amphritea sp. 2_MG-2023]|uniref:YbfB/YjiJ family MFS transporter n=1 Tax=Amphritea TaxID=515417 RepID=UPI001C07BBEE|nr:MULTISPECIES: YbfB/YjiJ family MFS transporter [Amphritea]MBU2967702.1 YbfB/YjiJ family MFS transporter [Amphritea atlantica]MDO6416980.1 YbfB/YjiJ family MFS transporter [Amphritea sp. 2_MG-2023]